MYIKQKKSDGKQIVGATMDRRRVEIINGVARRRYFS
jgi:hypothetical protein